jgi:hypothetical protein
MEIDRKFRFIGFNPSKSGKIVTEEDGIIVLASDKALPQTLMFYHAECKRLGAEPRQLGGIALLIGRVEAYQRANERKVKVADVDEGPEAAAVLKPNL